MWLLSRKECALNKAEYVRAILGGRSQAEAVKSEGVAFAPANIALCKYWGKRQRELNLPQTDSLSVSLDALGAHTVLRRAAKDRVFLNGVEVHENEAFFVRAMEFLRLFIDPCQAIELETQSSVPVAAGLASSASGFAALVLAMEDWFGWGLKNREASLLARIGSGSACRSVHAGFSWWHAGSRDDGMDCYAEALDEVWPDLRVGLLILESGPKPIGSREAMDRTIASSMLYRSWPNQVEKDLAEIRSAISGRDMTRLGEAAEQNALSMHATMIASRPAVLYWTVATVDTLRRVWALREQGVAVYATMDAGPNVKLLYEASSTEAVHTAFPGLIEVRPFSVGV